MRIKGVVSARTAGVWPTSKAILALLATAVLGVAASARPTTPRFAAPVDYAVGAGPLSVALADVDGDGQPDIVTANYGNGAGNTVSVLRNLGGGTFAARVDYGVGAGPYSVALADVDGDGRLDVVVANRDSNTVSVLRNLGGGAFAARVDYAVGSGPYSVALADVDGDGRPDIVTANYSDYTVSVLRNLLCFGDINGDGIINFVDLNLVLVGFGSSYTFTSLNNVLVQFGTQCP